MVVLRREAEDAERAALELLGQIGVALAQQARDGELATLDPELGRLIDRREGHHAAVGRANQGRIVARARERTRVGPELAIEESTTSDVSGDTLRTR